MIGNRFSPLQRVDPLNHANLTNPQQDGTAGRHLNPTSPAKMLATPEVGDDL
jgi:hypothetical protein